MGPSLGLTKPLFTRGQEKQLDQIVAAKCKVVGSNPECFSYYNILVALDLARAAVYCLLSSTQGINGLHQIFFISGRKMVAEGGFKIVKVCSCRRFLTSVKALPG